MGEGQQQRRRDQDEEAEGEGDGIEPDRQPDAGAELPDGHVERSAL